MLNTALELLDRGISVIPIEPKGKKPLVRWEEFQHRRATEEEVEAWFERWPDANLAIVCGSISGIWAMDVDGPEGMEWFSKNAPKTSVYSKTGKPSAFHAFYKIPAGVEIKNAVGWRDQIDIRAEGGYVVCPPSIHPSGVAYEWKFIPGLDGWDGLTEWAPPDNCQPALPDSSRRGNLAGVDLTGIQVSTESRASVPKGGRNHALAEMAGKWIAKGLDIDEALLLAEGWNRKICQPPMGAREVETTVRSVYRLDRRNHPERAPVENLPGLTAAVPEPCAPAEEFPAELLEPGGLLGEIMAYIERSTAVSYAPFNLAAAITVLGSIAGQRVMTETGLRTNMYCVCLGYSGCGKNAAHQALPTLLMGGECHRVMGPNDPTSASAIMHWLSKEGQQRTMLTIDEVGLLYQAIKKPHSPGAEIPKTLMEMFSGAGHHYTKSYATKDPVVLHWHLLGLYGTGTPETFWGGMTSSEVADGFLARLLMFSSDRPAPRPKETVDTSVPEALVEALDHVWNIPVDHTGGNLARIPVPFKVDMSREAKDEMARWGDTYFELRNEHRKEAVGSIYGRAVEHAAKLALVHAVSLYGAGVIEKEVGMESLRWAAGLVDNLVAGLVDRTQDQISDNEWEAQEKRVLALIKKKSTVDRPGLTAAEVGRFLHQSMQTRDSLLKTMVSNGVLVIMKYTPTRGPGCDIYCQAKNQ